MTVRDVAERLDGWTGLKVNQYVDELPYGRFDTVYDSEREGWVNVPEDLLDLEPTVIRIEHNTIVLDVED